MAGAVFLVVIVFSNVITLLKEYRQRLLNTRLMLSLRRSLFDRLLHLGVDALSLEPHDKARDGVFLW